VRDLPPYVASGTINEAIIAFYPQTCGTHTAHYTQHILQSENLSGLVSPESNKLYSFLKYAVVFYVFQGPIAHTSVPSHAD